MKWLAKSLPFHLFTNPCLINRFIFGQGVVIYTLEGLKLDRKNSCFHNLIHSCVFNELARLNKKKCMVSQTKGVHFTSNKIFVLSL